MSVRGTKWNGGALPAEDEQREETEEDETAGHYPAADATEEGLFGADVSAMAIGVADPVVHGERSSTSDDDVMAYSRAARAKSTLKW